MEVKDIKPTADVTFRVRPKTGDEQSIRFTVKFLGVNQIPDYVPKPGPGVKFRQSQVITEALIDAIDGWDLTHDGGKPLECNEETKRKYLPYILGLTIIREGVEPGDAFAMEDVLGIALVNFAGDAENFLKN